MSTLPYLTLEDVEKQFVAWRANKQGDKKIPASLWSQVKKLIGHYKSSVILHRLKISTQQAKDNGVFSTEPASDLTVEQKRGPDFVKVIMPAAPIIPLSLNSTLTLQRGEFILSLHHPTEQQVTLFMNALMS